MTMAAKITALARRVALDQTEQDIKNNETFATKADANGQTAVAVEQLIAFVNGYNGTSLDYRNYLPSTEAAVTKAWQDLGTGYLGG
nr:MAG TPA: hypothetical protein [Caudoviricetes sp.]